MHNHETPAFEFMDLCLSWAFFNVRDITLISAIFTAITQKYG